MPPLADAVSYRLVVCDFRLDPVTINLNYIPTPGGYFLSSILSVRCIVATAARLLLYALLGGNASGCKRVRRYKERFDIRRHRF
jgi:hypothetical protein